MTNTIEYTIGRNVKAYRNARGMSAKEFGETCAERLGKKAWPRQTVYMMEAGDRSFVIAELAVIANLLEVTLDDLVGGDYFPKHARPFEDGAIVKARLAEMASDLNRMVNLDG